jgi:hypothetical protein
LKGVTGLNQNIEIINPHLWAVNYHHLQYINDLTYHDKSNDALYKPLSISNDGVIVLNKSHEIYSTLKQMFLREMEKTDEELLYLINYMKEKDRDGYDRVFKHILDAEAKRRVVERQFNEQSKGKPIIERMLNLIGFNSKERR